MCQCPTRFNPVWLGAQHQSHRHLWTIPRGGARPVAVRIGAQPSIWKPGSYFAYRARTRRLLCSGLQVADERPDCIASGPVGPDG